MTNSAPFGRVLRLWVGLLVLSFLACLNGMARADVDAKLADKYRQIAASVDARALADTVKTLSTNGSRVVGYPGERAAADYVKAQFDELFGANNVKTETFTSTVPMDKGAKLEAGGNTYELNCMWPNLIRTSQLPPEGLSGKLLYAGRGALSSFNGKDVEGSIVLLDFNCGLDWMNAPRLGAKAVVFIEPTQTLRGEAEAKYVTVPLSIPRFYIKRSDAAALQALALGRKDALATVKGDMKWERIPARNFLGILPGQSKDPKIAKQIIVVQAYYDGISAVPALAPAADTASGMAGLLQAARTFKKMGNERTIWFVATTSHFLALQGVREFLDNHIDDWQVPGPFAKLFGQAKDPKDPVYLWAGLDLATQSGAVGIFYKAWFYDVREDIQSNFSDIARVARENNDKVAQTLGYDPKKRFADGVNPVDGKNWRNFIPGKPAFDSEAIGMAGGYGVTFATIDDSRNRTDTPFDTFDKVNIANLVQQMQTFLCVFQHYVNDSNDPNAPPATTVPLFKVSQFTRMGLRNGFATVHGRVREYNPRKSLTPSDPVQNALAIYPSLTPGAGTRPADKSYMGVRGYWVQYVTEGDPKQPESQATFDFKGVPPRTADNVNHSVGAYRVDPNTGDIDFAPDKGVNGQDYPTDITITTAYKDTTVVLFPCVATAIYDLVDQQALRTLSEITIFDGANNGEPRQYGFTLSRPEQGVSYVEAAAIIFARRGDEYNDTAPVSPIPGVPAPGTVLGATPAGSDAAATNKLRQFKILMGPGAGTTRFLLLNCNAKYPEGEGYVMGAASGSENSSRSSAIINTPLKVAKDMWSLDEFRINRLLKNHIRNEGVVTLHGDAKSAIDKAEAALAAKDYEAFDSWSRSAWGYESRAYPNVTKTQQDVVNGVIFYLALMIPFAYFLERLMFGFPDLKRQLLGVVVIFISVFGVFALIHPAFQISLNPGIILLSFIMLALSVLVTVLVWQKFEAQLKEQARETQGTHEKGAGAGSIALAAFSLGVSNMRRRKARTWLTCITLIMLTFTVLAFTSIVENLRFNQVPAPGNPRYAGILMRDPNWNALQQVAYQQLSDEFGKTRTVAPRGWFLGTSPGEQTFLTLKRADRDFGAKGLVGLSPQEAQVTGADKALAAGRWFEAGDRLAMIIPRKIADGLRITDADVGSAKVSFSGLDYTVIGILDQDRFKSSLDLDQEPLTPVDFVQMAQLQRQGKTDSSSGFQQYLHLDPDVVFFIPYRTMVSLGGDLRSVAVAYGADDNSVLTDLKDNLMKRFDMNLYASANHKIDRFSSIGANSSKGFETIVIPILIAALIVLNTMLTSVYERVKEIHTFSSIGLSPTNIGTLFMAEALVFGILGAVAGYILGQGVAQFLANFFPNSGLSLNFSSLSAVLSTLIIIGVVLLSTLFPANQASKVATPAIQRSWQIADPEGDTWNIRLPFAVTGDQARGVNGFLAEWFRSYEGYSVGDFITESIHRETFETEHGETFRVGCKAWLAPFDLGVSQMINLETVPTDFPDVYELKLQLTRVSGDVSNWKRVNRRFLNTLRKQFLIWRTLSGAERAKYAADAETTEAAPTPTGDAVPATA